MKAEVVFSRGQREKRYVQDRIRETASLISEELVSYDAHVYLCGQAKSFPSQVESAIIACLGDSFGFTEKEAKEYISDRKSQGMYHVECW